MVEIFQQILNAIVLGCVYCLIASGLTLVYGIMHVPNFAQGNIYMGAAYLVFLLGCILGFNVIVVYLATVFIMGLFGLIIERCCFRPISNTPHVNGFVIALGILMVIEGLIVILFGADYKEVLPIWKGKVEFYGITISIQRLLVIFGTFFVMVVLHIILKKTIWGMSLVAMSQNRELALSVGINVNRMTELAFFMSTALAGVGGILMAPISFVFPAMGMPPLLISFAAIIFGGFGSLSGAILGSFIMAFASVFSMQYIAAVISDIAIFGVMIMVLLFKPTGIMGGKN
jgi:branched-chain amino acid transport system permease protein